MALAKYLSRYAEPQAQQLVDFPTSYATACVLPCCDESAGFLVHNKPVFAVASNLLIVVINQPPAEKTTDANLALQAFIEATFAPQWVSPDRTLTLYDSGDGFHLLCVNACSPGLQLPAQHGVGLARKIGADIACQLFYDRKITTPWIFTTDADVKLPDDYFHVTVTVKHAAALLFPYRHVRPANPAHALAMDLYDYSLRYYVAGLQWAGSPYAFQTVGSTLAIHAEHYAKVRGFPKRSAGEDFYILNKLHKTGEIISLPQPEIAISARVSNRTPFGTGAALSQIMQLEDAERDYVFYHPQIFALLRLFLHAWPTIWQRLQDATGNDATFQQVVSKAIKNKILLKLLLSLDIDSGIQHAFSHSKTLPGFLKHLHDWFDASRTLKLVHALRDAAYPSINIAQLQALHIDYVPDWPAPATIAGFEYPPAAHTHPS